MSTVEGEYRALEERVLAELRDDLTEAEFQTLALEIHRFQCRWNAPYGRFAATRPEPAGWREIPAVPQSAFKRFALSVVPPELVATTFRTSGTTGEGFGQHHFFRTQLYDAAIRRGWQRLGLPAAHLLVLTPPPARAPFSSLSHMMGVLAAEVPAHFAAEAGGRLDPAAVAAGLAGAGPVAILGTALAFAALFESQFEREAEVIFALETGGYKGSGRELRKADFYAQFATHLGLAPADVINEYGMTELSSQCYTRGLGQPHTAPPWLRALVIDPESGAEVEDGATGVLRLFDLANLGSVLAVETQDLAVRRGARFELIGRDPAALPRGCSRAADESLRAG